MTELPLNSKYQVTPIQLREMNLNTLAQGTLDTNYFVELSQLALVQVIGNDAETFLQGQFSNDISRLVNDICQLHAYCNPKGRTLAVIRLMRSDNGFWMVIPREISEPLVKRLKMYVMRSKVEIQLDTGHDLFGFIGETENKCPGKYNYRLQSVIPRQIIISESDDTTECIAENQYPLCHGDIWRWLDIQSGIPQVYSPTVEVFIPQTINLELVDAISFKKGCFPGQEIVARIKYLGKPKQRLIVADASSTDAINPGNEIYSPEKPGQKSGLVVDAVEVKENHYHLSAMIPATMVKLGELRIGSVAGPKLTRMALPYEV